MDLKLKGVLIEVSDVILNILMELSENLKTTLDKRDSASSVYSWLKLDGEVDGLQIAIKILDREYDKVVE